MESVKIVIIEKEKPRILCKRALFERWLVWSNCKLKKCNKRRPYTDLYDKLFKVTAGILSLQ